MSKNEISIANFGAILAVLMYVFGLWTGLRNHGHPEALAGLPILGVWP